MENYLDGPENSDEAENFQKKIDTNYGLGCTGCLVIFFIGLAVAIGIVLFFSHLLNNYRV
jgi:hypothetical protein